LTRDEKVGLVMGTGMSFPGLPPDMQAPVVGATTAGVPGAAGTTLAIPRLGIPSIVVADVRPAFASSPRARARRPTYYCTAFPVATSLASSWDVDLVERVGRAMGNEVKEYGVGRPPRARAQHPSQSARGPELRVLLRGPGRRGTDGAAMVRGLQIAGRGQPP